MQQDDPEESLLEDLFDEPPFIDTYRKAINRARITLFALAGLQVLSVAYYFLLDYSIESIAFLMIYALVIAAIFTGLAFWTKKKPFTAIVVGLVLYTVLLIYSIIFYSYNWWSGILIRIFVYIMLISALKGAKQVQAWQDTMQKNK